MRTADHLVLLGLLAGSLQGFEVQIDDLPPVVVGTDATFTATISGGTPPYRLEWDFGDGSTSGSVPAGPTTHRYAAPGHYRILLRVRDGAGTLRSRFGSRLAHRPLAVRPPRQSRPLAVVGDQVWVCNPDQDSVALIDAVAEERIAEIAVGRHPLALAVSGDEMIWVVCRDDDTIHIIDPTTLMVELVLPLPYGFRPTAVAATPDDDHVLVLGAGAAELRRYRITDRQVVDRVPVGADPRHLAIAPDGSVLLPRFRSADTGGTIVRLDAELQPIDTIHLPLDPGPDAEDAGRGVPTQVARLAVSPDGQQAWYPSLKANVAIGLQRDGMVPDFESTVRTIAGSIDLVSGSEDLAKRHDFNDRDSAVACAFTPLGDYVLVALQGSDQVEVLDAYTGEAVAAVPVGRAPQGLALSADGRRCYVHDFLDRQISVLDCSALVDVTGTDVSVVAQIASSTDEALDQQVLQGKRIFYNAHDARMSQDGYLSCATCHLDGGHDGRTWDFTDRGEGLRNTITLRGRRGTGHGRVHWTANFDEIQDFEHDIRGPFGGLGFLADSDFHSGGRDQPLKGNKSGLSADLDALAAYVSSLQDYPRSPHRQADGTATAAGARGRAVFARLNCQHCHGGEDFTDSASGLLHDVGSATTASGGRLGGPLPGFDTPTLRGIWHTAPYLHDGRAVDLAAVFREGSEGSVHGLVQSLSASDRADLLAFLHELDGSDWAVEAGRRRISLQVTPVPAVEFEPRIIPAHDNDQTRTLDGQRWHGLSSALDYRIGFGFQPLAVGRR